MSSRSDQPLVPAVWQRHDSEILPLWRDRLCLEMGPTVASRYASGLFFEDRRRPIAQWFNPALNAALLVGIETSAEWPVQRFGLFYAPAQGGVVQVRTTVHEWYTRNPNTPPTADDAFTAAIQSAESFLQVEMDFF
ncbi:hypothetical protein [Arthrobacter psychrochitiniphilus]|uniref:Uncharacterized protein n=1 Tax=Arthrobacter psychrochitiniphilus TaxID=291045 RepID=A0A2V3DRR0_9MICC|nr:hypothetical protein [Arthrobacter psychrochitiniphilus]NYG19171.1 hypothetical protein [Arthrobacter psychrochitiniphilus]PXA65877.1 hypothetical protein CVS29_07615 [Arthrobacter psychrochitiniphilus]